MNKILYSNRACENICHNFSFTTNVRMNKIILTEHMKHLPSFFHSMSNKHFVKACFTMVYRADV